MNKLSNKFAGQSLSSATMKPEHLIPTFAAFLKEHAPTEYADLIKEAEALELEAHAGYGEYYADEEQADWILEDLFNALDTIAPDGTMFGSHEGDGALYGFWQYDDDADDEPDYQDERDYFDLLETEA